MRETPVRWSGGSFFSHEGTLLLTRDRLVLLAKGEPKFSLPKPAWEGVDWPWYGFGTTCKVRIDGKGYTISFVPLQPNYAQRARALDEASEWRHLLGGGPVRDAAPTLRGFAMLAKILGATCGLVLGILLAVVDGGWMLRTFWALVAIISAASFVMLGRSASR